MNGLEYTGEVPLANEQVNFPDDIYMIKRHFSRIDEGVFYVKLGELQTCITQCITQCND